MILYRYRDTYKSDLNELVVYLEEYPVVRETPCFWIIKARGREKRVGKSTLKKWAWQTVAEAYESYRIRKLRQVELSRRSYHQAIKILEYIGVNNKEINHFVQLGEDIPVIRVRNGSRMTDD